jgi:hypothetical protein
MPTSTYVALANITLTSDQTVTFSSIPNTYRDLVLVFTGQIYSDSVIFELNADNGNNYYMVGMIGASSGVFSNTVNFRAGAVAGVRNGFLGTDKIFSIVHFLDYSATDKHKTAISRANSTNFQVETIISRWANTNAVNSISVFSNSLTSIALKSGSTVALYGVIS